MGKGINLAQLTIGFLLKVGQGYQILSGDSG